MKVIIILASVFVGLVLGNPLQDQDIDIDNKDNCGILAGTWRGSYKYISGSNGRNPNLHI